MANDFVAGLVDLTAGSSHEEEEAIIPLTEISDYDATALRVGGIFRWVIGYERSFFGCEETSFPNSVPAIFPGLPNATSSEPRSGHTRRDGRSTCDGWSQPGATNSVLTIVGPGISQDNETVML